jgi:hypothetical protein
METPSVQKQWKFFEARSRVFTTTEPKWRIKDYYLTVDNYNFLGRGKKYPGYYVLAYLYIEYLRTVFVAQDADELDNATTST